ncbi:MAG: hypothetical protein HY606_07710 [Planctomycetes bacterium]|nr:hypothetical protein [Planctomycetota bacterium]
MNIYIVGSKLPRPRSEKTIYIDGAAGSAFREGVDIELSHWVPNRTPLQYKADTSTEIVINFAADPLPGDWDLSVNNHLDVDGILSVFLAVHPEFALKNRLVIVQAAEMGDFDSWGELPSQILFQGLTLYMKKLQSENVDLLDIYSMCFKRVIELVNGVYNSDLEITQGIKALDLAVKKIESGEIKRREYSRRFVGFLFSSKLAGGIIEKALMIPEFNALLTDRVILPPQVRNRLDKDKVQLVSVENGGLYYHDLFYPGYMWADTPNSWRAPGFRSGSLNGYTFDFQPLKEIVNKLQGLEEDNKGKWIIASTIDPFGGSPGVEGRSFPVVLSFMSQDNKPAQSSIHPEQLSQLLAPLF